MNSLEMTAAKDVFPLNDADFKTIDNFLKRRRKEVFWALVGREILSQSEWAEAADITPTSLSNILVRFESFQYKLVEGRISGRKKYYSLTSIGHSYVQYMNRCAGKQENETSAPIYSHEEFSVLKKAETSLDNLKAEYGDEWESIMNRILCHILMEETETDDKTDFVNVRNYLECVEQALVNRYENVVDRCMRDLKNPLLRDMVNRYFDVFYAFMPFIRGMEDSSEICGIFEIFDLMLSQNENTGNLKKKLRLLGLEAEGNQLYKVLQKLKQRWYGKTRQAIYNRLDALMPGMKYLNAHIASVLWMESHKKDENQNDDKIRRIEG